jgi:hypothetical protein
MIQVEILSGPDKNVLTKFEFHQNQIYLGKKSLNLNIEDPGLLDSHIMIEVIENELILHPQPGVSSYLLDGKRATTIRKIKPLQTITIGNTALRVLRFEETNFSTKKQVLDRKLAELIETNSPKLAVIEKLGRMMK